MDVRILGSAEVRHDGSPVMIRGAKPRQLLILLAIRANRPVPTDQLIEELWEGDPPPSAATALRVHFGRLRRVLEPDRNPSTASARLPAGPHGYLIRLEPEELDTDRFERKVLAARQANTDGDPQVAIPHLTSALDLWRGQALVDARDLTAVRSEVARLQELHAVALEELADARLILGEHALLVDVLQSAVEKHPFREKLTANLMLALYRNGRAPEALRAYAEFSKLLDDQLGVVPSPSLRRLEEDILLQRPVLDHVASGSTTANPVRLHPPGIRMIGRHKELRELSRMLQEPPSQRPRALLIAGPAGIGKTTLVEALCLRMDREGCRSYVGRCTLDHSEPYEPIVQILRLFESPNSTSDLHSVHITGPHPLLARGGLSSLNSDGDPASARFRLFEAITATFTHNCDARSLIVIEDLHWADRPTLFLIRHLVRNPNMAETCFVVTYREDDISGERLELIQSLAPPLQCHAQTLRPFHDGEVRSLVAAIAAPESVQILTDHASTLRRSTSGNPLFLRELLRELDDESVKLGDEADLFAALDTIAPAGICALIERRIARLSTIGKELLYAATILSDDISTELLAASCDASTEVTRDGVEECLAVRLLVEDLHDLDRFQFPHAMVRNAVYASIPPNARSELHRRVAYALIRCQGDTHFARIARHFCGAASLDVAREIERYSLLAASEAEGNLLFAESAGWYEQAIAWRSTSKQLPSLGQLYLALGRSYARDRQGQRGREAFSRAADEARNAGDCALLVDIALAAGGPWSSGSDLQALALELLREALGSVDPADAAIHIRALVCIASALYYTDHEGEGQAAHRAIDLAVRSSDELAIATAQLALHRWWTHWPNARAERLDISRSACERLTPYGPTGELFLRHQRCLLADFLESGEIVSFHAVLQEYENNAKRLCSPADIYWAIALKATEATLHGDLVAGEQLARGAALRGSEYEELSAGALILQRFVIRYEQGRLAEEVPVFKQVARTDSVFQAGAALIATTLSESGRHERAGELTWATLGSDGTKLARDVYWLGAVALFAGVAAAGEDGDLQDMLAELLSPCADHVVVFGAGGAVLGSGHQWLGQLAWAGGDVEGANRHLREALEVGNRIQAPFWVAQAQLSLSRLVCSQRSGDGIEESARLRDAAVATAERLGFGRILRQASEGSTS